MTRLSLFAIAVVTGVAAAALAVSRAQAGDQNDLTAPFAVTADSAPLDLTGHYKAFPWIGDFDADGRFDLLIGLGRRPGKPSGGHLRIYRNQAAGGPPRFTEPIWFDDLVPTGRIPSG